MLTWSTLSLLGHAWATPPTKQVAPVEQVEQAELASWTQDLQMISLSGEPFDSSLIDGKLVLFVNVASRCGFTPQYDGLQALWKKYQDQGLAVVGAPCNQFGNQEPGKPAEIASFCRANFGVDFPLLDKQDVKGDQQSALYAHLVGSPVGKNKAVMWNFEKFLVDPQGQVLARFRSNTTPEDPQLIEAIESGLEAL